MTNKSYFALGIGCERQIRSQNDRQTDDNQLPNLTGQNGCEMWLICLSQLPIAWALEFGRYIG